MSWLYFCFAGLGLGDSPDFYLFWLCLFFNLPIGQKRTVYMLSSMINRCLVIVLSSISTDLLSWLLLACNNSFILVWLSSPANPCCLRSGLLSWTLLLVLDGWMSISPANPRCRRSGVLYCWLALDVDGWLLISPANPLGSGGTILFGEPQVWR